MDELFQVPKLEEAKTVEEINGQMMTIGEAIERCEKMLQHMVIGNFASGTSGGSGGSQDIDFLMTKHLELISIRSDLEKKRKRMIETPQAPENENSTN